MSDRIGGETPERIRREATRLREEQLVSLVEALRRTAKRPRTAQDWIHAGPAMLEEAADQLEKARKQRDEELRERGWLELSHGEAIAAFKALTVYAETFPDPNLDAVREKLLDRICPDPAVFNDLESRSKALLTATQPKTGSEQ
jgi:hypothetical protein